MPTRVRFDRFYTYADLTETLDAWVSEFPGLCRIESIGKSYEGREIPLVTVTNFETGRAEEKPAVLVHAQIHAMEFTGTTAALHLVDRLLHGYGEDERVTRALDTRTPVFVEQMQNIIRYSAEKARSSPVIVKPHFSSTRSDARLSLATTAWIGRCATSTRNAPRARVATPLPHHSRPSQ